MFSLLLPPDCFECMVASREQPAPWRRRVHVPVFGTRSAATGLLRVQAMALRRMPVASQAPRWTLL